MTFVFVAFFLQLIWDKKQNFAALIKKAKTDKRKVFLKLCSKFNLKIIFYLSTSRFCLVGMGKKSCRRLQRILLKKTAKKFLLLSQVWPESMSADVKIKRRRNQLTLFNTPTYFWRQKLLGGKKTFSELIRS